VRGPTASATGPRTLSTLGSARAVHGCAGIIEGIREGCPSVLPSAAPASPDLAGPRQASPDPAIANVTPPSLTGPSRAKSGFRRTQQRGPEPSVLRSALTEACQTPPHRSLPIPTTACQTAPDLTSSALLRGQQGRPGPSVLPSAALTQPCPAKPHLAAPNGTKPWHAALGLTPSPDAHAIRRSPQR
jgi:hypothetical protein